MKLKSIKLINCLQENSPCTAKKLAERLSISTRSIKNYVKEINAEFPNTISSSQLGYTINIDMAKEIVKLKNERIPQSSEERIVFLLTKLMNTPEDITTNVYDLSEQMFVSPSTVKNELRKIKEKLTKYDLRLESHGDEVYIHGLEKNKRKLLSNILYDESNVNFVNLNFIQDAFTDIDIFYIKQTVLEIFSEYHYFINDYSLINLVLHITIAIDRIRNNNYNTENIDDSLTFQLHEYELATKLAQELENEFSIHYSDAEIYEMTLLIISRATTIDYKSITASNLENFIGKECLELVNQLIDDINNFYYIDLSEQEFLIRFALHIRNLLVRSKNDYLSKNPLTESIKTSCPLIYDVAVSLAGTIKEKTEIAINDDEIAYIAFHLGNTLEAQKNLTLKIRAALYCPNYYNMNQKITDTIKQYFDNDILITTILTDESEIPLVKDIDLIISTIPISMVVTTPLVQISLFMNDKYRIILTKKIEELRKTKKRNEFRSYLKKLIIPEFFEKNEIITEERECIDCMVQKMYNHGYVGSTFRDEIIERERISSTAFGSFAIPHTMKMHANKTGMNIIVSKKGIMWNNHPVNLVLMLCFNANERRVFNEIFDPITMILSVPENVKKLVCSDTYEDFVNEMVNLL